MKYEIGKSYPFGMFSVTINGSFDDTIVINRHKVPGTYYLVNVMPDNYDTIIEEHDLDSMDIVQFKPTIANRVACRGRVPSKIKDKSIGVWRDMIYRCYMPTSRMYPYFGAMGVTVHPKWMCYQYFMYDYYDIPGSDVISKDYSNRSYVIDLNDDQVYGLPLNMRTYGPGTCHIRPYTGSNVMNVMNAAMAGQPKPNNNPQQQKKYNNPAKPGYKFLSEPKDNSAPTPVQPPTNMEVKKMDQSKLSMVFDKHIPPTQADYDFMLQDLSFMDKYCKPEEIRSVEVNPVKHLIQPNTTPRAPGMREMCVIAKTRNDPTFDLVERRLRERVKQHEVNN